MKNSDLFQPKRKRSGLIVEAAWIGLVLSTWTVNAWADTTQKIKTKDPIARLLEINKMKESDPALIKLSGNLGRSTTDARESLARMKLATLEPLIKSRLSGLECIAGAYQTSATYSSLRQLKPGEAVTFTFMQPGRTLVQKAWNTIFFESEPNLDFKPANVAGKELLEKLLSLMAVTQTELSELVHSKIPEMRAAAAENPNFTDAVQLATIVKNDKDSDVRKAGISNPNLTDQTLLAKIAWHDKDSEVRMLALDKLTDQALLADIARNNGDYIVRRDAVKKIIDPVVLASVAKKDEDYGVGENVVENPHFADQALLADVAKNAKDSRTCMLAAKKLTGQAVLAEIAKKSKHDSVRKAVVENPNFTDQVLLSEIAKKDQSAPVREAAVKRLIDPELLGYAARNDKDRSVRQAGVSNPNLIDQSVLEYVAKNDKNEYVREAAVKKLTDQPALVHVARNDKTYWVRVAAIEKIGDDVLLANFAKNDKNFSIRIAAVNNHNLIDQALLADVAKNDEHFQVRDAAKKRLQEFGGK